MFSFLGDITWRPGIGDPNPIAWMITLAYFAVCGLCVWAGLKEKENQGRANEKLVPTFWFVLAGVFFFLGWKKQLGNQKLFLQNGGGGRRGGGGVEKPGGGAAGVLFLFVLGGG